MADKLAEAFVFVMVVNCCIYVLAHVCIFLGWFFEWSWKEAFGLLFIGFAAFVPHLVDNVTFTQHRGLFFALIGISASVGLLLGSPRQKVKADG